MVREGDIRLDTAQENLPNSIAINPSTGQPWVVRCTGSTTSAYSVNCTNASLGAMLAVAGSGDVLLAGGGASSNLSSSPVENGRPTLRLAPGTQLAASGNAPTLATQFGPANLTPIFGSAVGAQAAFSNGVLSIGSNTSISGFNFTNTSITNYSTSNVLVANNQFTGSYSPTPGTNTYNELALPTIQLVGAENVTISGNTFTNPNLQSYASAQGAPGNTFVCGRDDSPGFITPQQGICLSGNAIRMTNSNNYNILNNSISGALDEAVRLDNPNGIILVKGNAITNMRMGPDTNIGAAIFVRQNTGTSTVIVEGNTVTNNAPGRNLIATAAGNTLLSGSVTPVINNADNDFGNVIDALEVGVCRGRQSFPRADDLYGDADILDQNCNPAAPPTLNFIARNNVLLPNNTANGQPGWFDNDGIDLNIGSYSTFNAIIGGNRVEVDNNSSTPAIGGNAFTSDFRGQTFVNLSISNNLFTSQDAPIDILTQTIDTPTAFSTGQITISNNMLINNSSNAIFSIQTSSNNTSQTPVPVYSIIAPGYTAGAPNSGPVRYGNAPFSEPTGQPIVFFNDQRILPVIP